MLKGIQTWFIALAVAASGGAIFVVLGLPLPWTLGSMTSSALLAAFYNRWPMPSAMRTLARPVVGVLAGAAFTPQIIGLVPGWWPAILSVLVYSLAVSALGYFVFTRISRMDKATAYCSAVPGGLGEMSLFAETLGGQVRTIVLVHSVRIVAVVFTIPFLIAVTLGHEISAVTPPPATTEPMTLLDAVVLVGAGVAGFVLGRYGRFPGGEMVAAMMCSALVHATGITHAAPPDLLVIFAQILIGAVAGARFAGITLLELKTTVLSALGWAVALLVLAALAAGVAAHLTDIDFVQMLLAMSPGGTAEMIIITFSLGAEVAFVALCQISRIFLVLTLAPLVYRLFVKGRPPKKELKG